MIAPFSLQKMNILSWLKDLFSRKKKIEVDKPTSFVGSSPQASMGGVSELPTTNIATADELNKLKDELAELKTKTLSALDEVEKQNKTKQTKKKRSERGP